MKAAVINGHKISYLEQGEGYPVILIHGIPTSNLMWRNIMPELAKTRHLIAPDLLNYACLINLMMRMFLLKHRAV